MARPKTKTGQQRKRRPVLHLCGSANDGGIWIFFFSLIIVIWSSWCSRGTLPCVYLTWIIIMIVFKEKEMNYFNRVCVWILLYQLSDVYIIYKFV